MVNTNPTTSVIALTYNGISLPIKKQKLSEWIKSMIQLYVVYKRYTLNVKLHVENKWMENVLP